MSEDLGPLAAALAKAQAEFPAITRDRTVTVTTKAGQKYTFAYAPLDVILSAVRPALSKHALAITQLLDGGELVTMLLHDSGASLSGRMTVPLGPGDSVQQLGSAITYLRRYAIQAILGVASEEDDDGTAHTGNQATFNAHPRDRVQDAIDLEAAASEAYEREHASRPVEAPRAVPAAPGPSAADIANLRARFTPEEMGSLTGMTTAELFQAAEGADIPKARLSVAAKMLFGLDRWRITDLTDEERATLWADVAAVTA